MSFLLQEGLGFFARGLKRKRSLSSDDSDDESRISARPSFGGDRERHDSVAGNSSEHPIAIPGSCLEHPIEIEDDPADAVARTLPLPAASAGQFFVLRLPPPPASELSTLRILRMDDPDFLRAKLHVEYVTGFTFTRPDLLREALCPVRGPPFNIEGRIVRSGNWRLALLGDTVLRTVLMDSRIWQEESLGETHRYAQRLLTNAALAGVARHHRLDEDLWSWVPRTQATGVKILGTLIEAILGAIWIDCEKNLLVVRTVLERLYGFPLG